MPERSPRSEVGILRNEIEEAVEALELIAEQQQKTLAMLRSNGIVFDSIGREPGNWQHVAFTIYTDLCEIDSVARNALEYISECRNA